MSDLEHRLNFYVVELQGNVYNLHNLNTDKEVLTDITAEELRDFLTLNDPDHPYLFMANKNEEYGLYSMTSWASCRYAYSADLNYTETTPQGSQYNADYITWGEPYHSSLSYSWDPAQERRMPCDELQMDLPFPPVDKERNSIFNKLASGLEVIDKTSDKDDSDYPYLPEQEG